LCKAGWTVSAPLQYKSVYEKSLRHELEDVETEILKPILATELFLEFAHERKIQREIKHPHWL